MSMNLYWEPQHRDADDLPDSLKFALRKRYGPCVDTVFTTQDISYLRGLEDAGVKGASDLIEAIEKHDAVRVFER